MAQEVRRIGRSVVRSPHVDVSLGRLLNQKLLLMDVSSVCVCGALDTSTVQLILAMLLHIQIFTALHVNGLITKNNTKAENDKERSVTS